MSSKDLTDEAAERNRQRAREWRQRNPERAAETKRRYRERDPEAYLALRRAASQRYADANRERVRQAAIDRRVALRSQVINAYGGRCACPGCHVVHAELLTVDHVGAGARHRQNRRSTRDIYAEIVRAGFPPEFQLLCGSCNLAKSDSPTCPLAGRGH